jgi:hypothetical protein
MLDALDVVGFSFCDGMVLHEHPFAGFSLHGGALIHDGRQHDQVASRAAQVLHNREVVNRAARILRNPGLVELLIERTVEALLAA